MLWIKCHLYFQFYISFYIFNSLLFFLHHVGSIAEGESMRSPSRSSNYVTQPNTSSGSASSVVLGNGYAHSSSFTTAAERVKSSSPTIATTPHRSSAPSSRNKEAAIRSNGKSSSSSGGSRSSSHHHRDDANSNSTGRSRSPPVVTIAPTLNSGLHYQDSRKVI